MKLDKENKDKIDNYFDGKSPEELLEISKKYDMVENKDRFDEFEQTTDAEHHLRSIIMEQACETAEKLCVLECKLNNITVYSTEHEGEVEVQTFTDEAQDIFNVHYDEEMTSLYELFNLQLRIIEE